MRCPQCSGYLRHEPELLKTPARLTCILCGWMMSDAKFRKELPRYFPPDKTDKMIEWQKQHRDYDFYYPRRSAAQLGISESFFKYSVRLGSAADPGAGEDCLQYAGVTGVAG